MSDNQDSRFSDKQIQPASGGGLFLAVGTISGAIIGGMLGQPSIGLLVGLLIGGLIALALYLKER